MVRQVTMRICWKDGNNSLVLAGRFLCYDRQYPIRRKRRLDAAGIRTHRNGDPPFKSFAENRLFTRIISNLRATFLYLLVNTFAARCPVQNGN